MASDMTPESNHTATVFRKIWPLATDDNNVTLHGFRRFKVSHLLNLRFLEQEIAELDHEPYQAGLNLGLEPTARDRLGLKHSKLDSHIPPLESAITPELVSRLRKLLQQYDEALAAFNNVMNMETVSLLDDIKQSHLQTDLTLFEKYKTRLVRVDLDQRGRTDPFQRWIHKRLRALRYSRINLKQESSISFLALSEDHWSYQNTVLIAAVIGRIVTTLAVTGFLVAPLAILSASSIKGSQLGVICGCIVLFSAIVAAMLKVSSYEMMAASAAYAAVLAVFLSNES